MSDNVVYKIVSNATIAAIYFVITYLSTPIAFGQIQIRIAEAMILLCFFRRDYWIGLTLGCLLSNLTSPLGWPDIVFGTSATLISSLLVAYASPCLLIGVIYPVVANAFVVGAELYFIQELPFWINVAYVGVGELIAVSLGYAFLMIMKKRKGFLAVFKADRHLDFKF